MDRDRLINRRIQRIAKDEGCTVAEVHAALYHHPIGLDRDLFLRRTLRLELSKLDALEEAFADKAMSGDVAAGALLLKIYERRATLLGLNAPVVGHTVSIVQHVPPDGSSTDKVERVLRELMSDRRPADALEPPKSDKGGGDKLN